MAINKAWHEAHKMPPKATMDERVEWHMEHIKDAAAGIYPAQCWRR